MIIDCGKRRLVSYRYGWMIQIRRKHKKTGEIRWREDPPAYPASLSQACQMMAERIFSDGDDITPDQIPAALKAAVHKVHLYMEQARKLA